MCRVGDREGAVIDSQRVPGVGVSLGVGKAGDVNCEDGRVKAVGDGGMAGKEEAPLESYPSKSPLCPPSALSLRANSPAAVPGVLGLKGQWAL